MNRNALYACLVIVLPAAPLAAQQAVPQFPRWHACAASECHPVSRSASWLTPPIARRDYRYEGLVVGGVAFGVLGAWIGSELTQAAPSTRPGTVLRHVDLGMP